MCIHMLLRYEHVYLYTVQYVHIFVCEYMHACTYTTQLTALNALEGRYCTERRRQSCLNRRMPLHQQRPPKTGCTNQ